MEFSQEQQEFIQKLIDKTVKKEREVTDGLKVTIEKLTNEKTEKETETIKLQEQIEVINQKFEDVIKEKEQLQSKSLFSDAVIHVENELKEKVPPAIKKLIQLKGLTDKDQIIDCLKAEMVEDVSFFEEKIKSKNLVYFDKDEDLRDVNFGRSTNDGDNKYTFDDALKSKDEKNAILLAFKEK